MEVGEEEEEVVPLRVLGLDPGKVRLGWGLVVDEDGLKLPQVGIIPNPADPLLSWNEDLNNAIVNVADSFKMIYFLYRPDAVAAEIVPTGKLGSNSERVVACITVCKTLAHLWGCPWYDYGANTVKETVAGDGLATKAQIKRAVWQLFPEWEERHKQTRARQKEEGDPRPVGIPADAWDGAAIAVTHHAKQGEPSDH